MKESICITCGEPIKLNHDTYGTWIHKSTLNTGCYNPDEVVKVATPKESK